MSIVGLVPRRGTWIFVSTLYALASVIFLLLALITWGMLSWPLYVKVAGFTAFLSYFIGGSASAIIAWRMPELYEMYPPKSVVLPATFLWWAPRALYLYLRTERSKQVVEPTEGMATWTRAAAAAVGLASVATGIFLGVLGVVGYNEVGAISLILLVPAVATVALGILGILRRGEARPSDFPRGIRGPFAVFDPVARKRRGGDAP